MSALIDVRMSSPRFFTHFERFLRRPQLGTTFDNPTAYTLPALALTTLGDSPANIDALRDDLSDNWEGELETYFNTTLDNDLEAWLNTELPAYLTQAYQANRNFELFGTSADNAGVTFLEGGGIRLETAGASADQHIIGAHLETTMTSLAGMNWDSANQIMFVTEITTGPDVSDVHNNTTFAGFKLTATDVLGTDADQFMFRVPNTGSPGTWRTVNSVNGTDVEFDTGITLAAATSYQLAVILDDARTPHYYINGELVNVGLPVRSLSTYEFYVGIADRVGGGAAIQLDIRNLFVSQLYG